MSVEQRIGRTRRVALLAVGALIVLFIVLSVPAGNTAVAPPCVTASPTPTALPPSRGYDPPAGPGVVLPAASQQVDVARQDGHPRIVKLWGGYDASAGIDFYAQYDVIISSAFTDAQILHLRSRNPSLVVLYSGIGTYDEDTGPLGSQWVDAAEGTDAFECFYRGTDSEILRVDYWGHGMFNMGDDWCTDAIVAHLASGLGSRVSTIYDGVFFDRVTQVITPHILDGIDLDHDHHVDDRNTVNELYWRGTERFLDKVRQSLGDEVIITANDAPLFYTSRLNGREYESFIRTILDGDLGWTGFRYNYEQWMQASREPRLTMVMANPPLWMEQKYGLYPWVKMERAVVEEAAAHHSRMRFGLTTALMEGGLYSFEFGTTWHGNAWWYDEFDGAGLGKGYLGSPLGEAFHATGPLTTENAVQDPGFEEPELSAWVLRTAPEDTEATLDRVTVTLPYTTTGTTAARVTIAASSRADDVRLEQAGISLAEAQSYTLSFWGKASAQLWDTHTGLHASGDPDTVYGLADTRKLGTTWQQYWTPFTATASTGGAVLSLQVGSLTGTVWIDQVTLQEGTLPDVFRRDFEHGVVLCNASDGPQTVDLGATYRRIPGAQAPRVKIIADDADGPDGTFTTVGGWVEHQAGYDDWGESFLHALTTTDPDGFRSSVTWRPNIPYADHYTVYAWVAPHDKLTDTVTYAIRHALGTAQVTIDPAVDGPGWVELGRYRLDAGTGNRVKLTNLSRSAWVVADAVKFESVTRYNDGRRVTSIVLEGQDGIILLNDLPPRLYLPLVGRSVLH